MRLYNINGKLVYKSVGKKNKMDRQTSKLQLKVKNFFTAILEEPHCF